RSRRATNPFLQRRSCSHVAGRGGRPVLGGRPERAPVVADAGFRGVAGAVEAGAAGAASGGEPVAGRDRAVDRDQSEQGVLSRLTHTGRVRRGTGSRSGGATVLAAPATSAGDRPGR